MTPMQEIAPGLHRWTAWHDHWEEDVGALAVETGDGLVFIDPIDPPVELGPAGARARNRLLARAH